MIIVGLLLLFVFVFIIVFAFPQFSPVPYYPSNYKDKELILKHLGLKHNQTVIDLGAGDGWVIFEAARLALSKKLKTQFVATEINPFLLFLLYCKRLFHPNKKNIQIRYFDIFKHNYSKLTTNNYQLITFYLYLSPWLIAKIWRKIKTVKNKRTLVAYYYPIKGLIPNKTIKGINEIYLYN